MQTVDFKKVPLNPGDRVLDLGCGEGRHVIHTFLLADIDAVGVDISLDDLLSTQASMNEFVSTEEQITEEKSFYLAAASALQLPFDDAAFDVVICSEVLEHIIQYRAALLEISRVLKPDGVLIISVPREWPERICWRLSDAYHQVDGGHVRIFNAHKLRDDTVQLGFRLYHRHWAHALHAPYWWLKCWFWEKQDQSRLIALYHRFLLWDLLKKPWITQCLERILNPLMGKSVVMYFVNETDC